MYYSEFARVRGIGRFLERLAYASVAFDALAAIGTLFVLEGRTEYSQMILSMSNYLIFIEVAVAAVAVGAMFALRHYKKVFKGWDRMALRVKYRKQLNL